MSYDEVPVNYHHKDYDKWYPIWERIEDAIRGEDEVKRKKERYLPKLPGQKDTEYKSYLQRASYQNFSGRILDVAIGQIFRKAPVISGFSEYEDNIDLAGNNFNYFTRDIFEDIIPYNRDYILVDYSEDQKRPFLKEFDADDVINWGTTIIKGEEKLSFVVIEGETEDTDDTDPYIKKCKKIWKELYLDLDNSNDGLSDGYYKSRDWEKYIDPKGEERFRIIEGSNAFPKMSGKGLNFIPFFMMTNAGFKTEIDSSPMLDIVNTNLGHYQNYADYENLLHLTGVGTYILRGWGDKKAFPIGGAADFPIEGGAEILQGKSDSGLENELRHKEEIMAMLGSQLLSGKGRYVQSARTADVQSQGEYATLADIANSMSYMMTQIMKLFMQWASGNPDEVQIKFNTDYEATMAPQGVLTELSGLAQSGGMSWKTYFYNLNKYEIYPVGWTIEDEQKEIDNDQKKKANDRISQLNNNIQARMQSQQQSILPENI